MVANAERRNGYGLTVATERYHPELFRSFSQRIQEERIPVHTRAFDNQMPLILVGSADHALLMTAINGDNWQQAFSEMCFVGSAMTLDPDRSGRNVERLGIMAPFADLRQDRRTRKPIPDSTGVAIVKSQFVFTTTLARAVRHVAGAEYFVTLDAHSYYATRAFETEGVHFINLSAMKLFADTIREQEKNGTLASNLMTVVGTTDIGDINRAFPLSNYLDAPLVIVDKQRIASSDGTTSEVHHRLIWGDPRGKRVIIFDDSISGGGTSEGAVELYTNLGAEEIIICATHPIFVKDYYTVLQGILRNPKVKAIFVTNSLPLEDRQSGGASVPYVGKDDSKKSVQVLDISSTLAHAAHVLLQAPSLSEAKVTLGELIWDMQDPYDLLMELTGMQIPRPFDQAVYVEGGEIYPIMNRHAHSV